MKMEKKELSSSYIVKKRINKQFINKTNTKRLVLFIIAFISSLIILITLYFLSPQANIYRINVKGLTYLSEEEILNYLDVSTKDKFFFVSKASLSKKLMNLGFIKKVSINKLNGNILEIELIEKRILGYNFVDKAIAFLDDNTSFEIDNLSTSIITKVPYIHGFDDEKLKDLLSNLTKLNDNTLRRISEITNYSLSYDPDTIVLITDNGNYNFISKADLALFNDYDRIYNNLEKKTNCIFYDALTSSAFASKCPWEKEEVKKEEVKKDEATKPQDSDDNEN